MDLFFTGFEKRALQDTRLKEDIATGLTSIIPFGSTAHTLTKKVRGDKDTGIEWLSRMGGNIGAQTLAMSLMKQGPFGRLPTKASSAAALVGIPASEILANRWIHGHKYDEKGKLKKKYKRKD